MNNLAYATALAAARQRAQLAALQRQHAADEQTRADLASIGATEPAVETLTAPATRKRVTPPRPQRKRWYQFWK